MASRREHWHLASAYPDRADELKHCGWMAAPGAGQEAE